MASRSALCAALLLGAAHAAHAAHAPSGADVHAGVVRGRRAERVACGWTDPRGNDYDVSALTGVPAYVFRDAMEDWSADSVHNKATGPVYFSNSDQYDFWARPCAGVMSPPPPCEQDEAHSIVAFQVVVPKQEPPPPTQPPDDGDEPQPPPRRVARKAAPRDTPATECHALGSIRNVTWSSLDPRGVDPSAGVKIVYGSGDACVKKVVTPGFHDEHGRYVAAAATWVNTRRSIELRLRCEPGDSHSADVVGLLMMARRVAAFESEMCHYVIDIPTPFACPSPPSRVARNTVLGALAAAVLLVVVALWRAKRQRGWLAMLFPHAARGDKAAAQQLALLLVSGKPPPLPRRHSRDSRHDV